MLYICFVLFCVVFHSNGFNRGYGFIFKYRIREVQEWLIIRTDYKSGCRLYAVDGIGAAIENREYGECQRLRFDRWLCANAVSLFAQVSGYCYVSAFPEMCFC